MQSLLADLQAIHPLSDGAVQYIGKNLKKASLDRREYLLKTGTVCDFMGFVSQGLLRCFYDKNDQEVCTWFMGETAFVTSIWSYFNRMPSHEYIQAIEPSVIYYLTWSEMEFMYEHYPEFNFIVRVLLQRYYCLSEERLYNIRKLSAAERYQFLLNKYPDIIQRVPSKDIASYLDISEWTLSRVRGRV